MLNLRMSLIPLAMSVENSRENVGLLNMPQPIGSVGEALPMAEWSIQGSLKDEAPEGEVSYHGFLVSELKPRGMGGDDIRDHTRDRKSRCVLTR
jgi:hypothetical protein